MAVCVFKRKKGIPLIKSGFESRNSVLHMFALDNRVLKGTSILLAHLSVDEYGSHRAVVLLRVIKSNHLQLVAATSMPVHQNLYPLRKGIFRGQWKPVDISTEIALTIPCITNQISLLRHLNRRRTWVNNLKKEQEKKLAESAARLKSFQENGQKRAEERRVREAEERAKWLADAPKREAERLRKIKEGEEQISSFEDMVGMKVHSSYFHKDTGCIFIRLENGDGGPYRAKPLRIVKCEPWGDCCANCFVQHVVMGCALKNAIIRRVEDMTFSESYVKEAEENACESVDIFGHVIHTDRGSCSIEMRVEHNGYYGGSLNIKEVDAMPDGAVELEDF